MSPLNFEDLQPARSRLGKPLKLIVGIASLAAVLVLGSTLAANINLNKSMPIEFGQGVEETTACDSAITVSPVGSFSNASGAGSFMYSGLILSGVDTTMQGCAGKTLTMDAYGVSGSSLSTSEITISSSGSFSSTDGVLGNQGLQGATSGTTLTFISPTVDATDVYRITIQSANRYTPSRGIGFVPYSSIALTPGINESGDFTIEGWIRSPDWTQYSALMPYVGNACGAVILQSISNTSWVAFVDCSNQSITFTLPDSTVMSDDQWLYWVFVKDHNGQAMFIDGVKLDAVSANNGGSTNLPISGDPDIGEIGQWSYWDTSIYRSNNGVIGEMRLSNISRVASTAIAINPTYAAGGQPSAQLQSDSHTVMLLEPPLSGSGVIDSSGHQVLAPASGPYGPPKVLNFK